MEFNEAKYKECDDVHDWGYDNEAGICVHCGLIHDCKVENEYEYVDEPYEGYRCAVCHFYADKEVTEEIEQANKDAREVK